MAGENAYLMAVTVEKKKCFVAENFSLSKCAAELCIF